MDVAPLVDLLHETAEPHDRFEKAASEHDWWDWYAAYLDARQSGRSPDEADAAADRYMAEIKGVVVPSAWTRIGSRLETLPARAGSPALPTTAGVRKRGTGPGCTSASTVAVPATAR